MGIDEPIKYHFQTTLYGETIQFKKLGDFSSITPQTNLSELNLNWSEHDLPERLRTKHVHRLHPYLGKFIPQLVEVFLRKFRPTKVCDPFCGSGTTLVEANALGISSFGADISEFNCLISKVKVASYDIPKLERELQSILARTKEIKSFNRKFSTESKYLPKWFAPSALRELLIYLSLVDGYEYSDLMKVVLSRAARSSRLTTHFDLDFPKKPQSEPYYCYKHRRTCKPTANAITFLSRYSSDTLQRIKEFSKLRSRASVEVVCGDSQKISMSEIDAVITSPPYVGLIDYHEQHKYAYELLKLPTNAESEIGSAKRGKSKGAQQEYLNSITKVFSNVRKSLDDKGKVVVVVNDKNQLYNKIAENSGYELESKLTRHVDRRTGMRSTQFFEDILIWRPSE